MKTVLGLMILAAALLASPALAQPAVATGDGPVDPAPTAADWAALGRLPDWSGTWVPNIRDQIAQVRTNPTPWTPKVAEEVALMTAEAAEGRPRELFIDCLPEGTPSWMLISHNALEFLFTPGRVTMLGETDGNRLRRIYTDGRGHPPDVDPTFHGDSVGHWEGDTLVVDTVGILPQAWLALGEEVGVPNDGDMHVVERLHLVAPDVMHDDLEITAPKVLTRPWKTTRIYSRRRLRRDEIAEGVCIQGAYAPDKDKNGHDIFKPIPMEGGNPVPLDH